MNIFEKLGIKTEKLKSLAEMSREELLVELDKLGYNDARQDFIGDLGRDIHAKLIADTDQSRSGDWHYTLDAMNENELRAAVEVLRLNADLDQAIEAEKK